MIKIQKVFRVVLYNKSPIRLLFQTPLLILLMFSLVGFWGCKGETVSPTTPLIGTDDDVSPTPTETPDKEQTPTSDSDSCDNYGDTSDDSGLEFLETDGSSISVSMDCTGDIDWYKIELSETPVDIEIELTDIPTSSDFDMILYDSNVKELKDGRSAKTGNDDESLSLTVDDSLLYLQIYSYTGSGEATLTVTLEDVDGADGDDEPDEDIDQLSYEEVLDTEFPSYPRGTTSDVLDRSVEMISTQSVSCQISDSEQLSGIFTIGNYAHVGRDLLNLTDYIDGWAVVVFNGSEQLLDMLHIEIRVIIDAPGLDLEVTAPYEMGISGNEYTVLRTRDNVYFVAETYGDFSGNSRDDLQLSSGVVGDLGDLFSNDIFKQHVEVEWFFEDEKGVTCFGSLSGKPITDFELRKLLPTNRNGL